MGQDLSGVFNVWRLTGFGREAGHLDVGDSAWRNVAKRLERGFKDVKSKPVHGHPVPDSNANRCDLLVAHPNAREPFPPAAFHAKLAASENDNFLKKAHVAMKVASATFEVDDGICDELAGAVPRSLSATIDLKNRMWQCPRAAKTGLIATAADRIDRIVLENQELFVSGSCKILADEAALQIQCLPIFDATKPLDFDGFHVAEYLTFLEQG